MNVTTKGLIIDMVLLIINGAFAISLYRFWPINALAVFMLFGIIYAKD